MTATADVASPTLDPTALSQAFNADHLQQLQNASAWVAPPCPGPNSKRLIRNAQGPRALGRIRIRGLDTFAHGHYTSLTLAARKGIEMDPNETLRLLAKALLEEDKDAAREFHGYLTEWLRRGGFEPAWMHLSKRQFNAFDPATGMLSK